MNCDCEPGMKKIDDPICFNQVRSGFVYDDDHFIPMKYCPWCGEKLKES